MKGRANQCELLWYILCGTVQTIQFTVVVVITTTATANSCPEVGAAAAAAAQMIYYFVPLLRKPEGTKQKR